MLTSFKWRQQVFWLVATTVAAVVICAAAIYFAWPYLKYDEVHRAAARHLDEVTVEGFDYVGENAADPSALSRFWIRRGTMDDPGSVVRYDGRPPHREIPGRDSLARSRYEQEIGWLSWLDDQMPCSLSVLQVHELMPGVMPKISTADRNAIESGTTTLIRVAVTCGAG
jgi:hypothetical protein